MQKTTYKDSLGHHVGVVFGWHGRSTMGEGLSMSMWSACRPEGLRPITSVTGSAAGLALGLALDSLTPDPCGIRGLPPRTQPLGLITRRSKRTKMVALFSPPQQERAAAFTLVLVHFSIWTPALQQIEPTVSSRNHPPVKLNKGSLMDTAN